MCGEGLRPRGFVVRAVPGDGVLGADSGLDLLFSMGAAAGAKGLGRLLAGADDGGFARLRGALPALRVVVGVSPAPGDGRP